MERSVSDVAVFGCFDVLACVDDSVVDAGIFIVAVA